MYVMRYLRVFDYVSVSSCGTGPARESAEGRLQMEKRTNAPIPPIRPLPGDSAPLGVINTAATIGGNESHSRGGGGLVREEIFPITNKCKEKNSKEKTAWVEIPSPPHGEPRY